MAKGKRVKGDLFGNRRRRERATMERNEMGRKRGKRGGGEDRRKLRLELTRSSEMVAMKGACCATRCMLGPEHAVLADHHRTIYLLPLTT